MPGTMSMRDSDPLYRSLDQLCAQPACYLYWDLDTQFQKRVILFITDVVLTIL